MTVLCGAVPRILLVALIIIVTILRAEGIAQPCNPAIDGTYCAEQMSKRPSGACDDLQIEPEPWRRLFFNRTRK